MRFRFIAVATALFASLCFAQDEAVVVTATRFPEARSRTLQPVTVISARDIEQSGQQTLPEVLQALGGVEIVANGGFGQPSVVFMRGANGGHTLVLVDGMRISSATTGTTALENIPLSEVERIEVVPGELSSLYGSDAIGGVIQIFTRGGEGSPAQSASAGVGSFDTRSLSAGLRKSTGKTDFSVNAGYFDSGGFDATAPADPLHNPDRDPYRNRNVSAKLAQHLGAHDELGVTLFASEGDTHFDSGPGSDDVNHQTLGAFSLYSRNRVTSSWQSLVRVGQGSDDSHVTGAFPSFFRTREPQVTWQNDVTLGPGTAIAGLEYLEQRVDSDTSFVQTSRSIRSAFAGYTGRYARSDWQLNLRQDDNSQFGSHTTGLVGYAYHISSTLRLRIGAGTAFRAPSFNDLYFPGFSNPNLRPEQARSREAGVRYEKAHQRFSATYFENRITDLIVLDPAFVPQNIGRATIKGTELAYEAAAHGWRARAQATLQDPRDAETGTTLPRRARQFASASLTRTSGPLSLGAEILASGARFDTADNAPDSRMHGYTLVNFTASYRLSRHAMLRARWNNVFDRQYELAKDFNTPGSNVFAGIQLEGD